MSAKTVILITGANGGVGWESTRALTADSPDVHVVVGSRSVEKGKQAISELEALKLQGSMSLVQLDLTDDDSIAKAAEEVKQQFGHIDVLVNNAGINSREPDARKRFRETFDTNVTGSYLVTEAFLPLLKHSKDPRLLFITSGLGSIGLTLDPSSPYYRSYFPHYQSSKAALDMLGALYLKRQPAIKVWLICPGFLATNISGDPARARQLGGLNPEEGGKIVKEVVTGRWDADVGKIVSARGVYPW